MTALTHASTDAVRRSTLRDLVRRSASGVATLARWLTAERTRRPPADRHSITERQARIHRAHPSHTARYLGCFLCLHDRPRH